MLYVGSRFPMLIKVISSFVESVRFSTATNAVNVDKTPDLFEISMKFHCKMLTTKKV